MRTVFLSTLLLLFVSSTRSADLTTPTPSPSGSGQCSPFHPLRYNEEVVDTLRKTWFLGYVSSGDPVVSASPTSADDTPTPTTHESTPTTPENTCTSVTYSPACGPIAYGLKEGKDVIVASYNSQTNSVLILGETFSRAGEYEILDITVTKITLRPASGQDKELQKLPDVITEKNVRKITLLGTDNYTNYIVYSVCPSGDNAKENIYAWVWYSVEAIQAGRSKFNSQINDILQKNTIVSLDDKQKWNKVEMKSFPINVKDIFKNIPDDLIEGGTVPSN